MKDSVLPSYAGNKPKTSLSPLLFNTVLEFLASAIREEKEIKGIAIRKEEIKLPD